MQKTKFRKNILTVALGACIMSLAPNMLLAAATDGALTGRVTTNASGTSVVAKNLETGLERSVTVDAKGNYRFPFLPVGTYRIEVSSNGQVVQTIDQVSVSLGNATTLNIGNSDVLDTVVVKGGVIISPIDVSSVESATNFTAKEIERLPVPRDASAVALLTPGVNKGDPDLGGISFGGSSIAENSVYINGLNVTDFYNRVGFSSVPFSFFKEFQIKTGGYSVEFGRTTGGVINAVTNSGTNELRYGAELVWQPSFLQTSATDRYDSDGNPVRISSYDQSDSLNLNGYVSGAIVQDKLFFSLMYEARNLDSDATTNSGNGIAFGDSSNGFWGAKFDWHLNDSNLIEFLAFSDKNDTTTKDYEFDLDTGDTGAYRDTRYSKRGGDNYALTWTSYLTESLSMKVLYGGNNRQSSNTADSVIDCNRIRDRRTSIGQGDVGCTSSGSVFSREDDREMARLDFEWVLNDHLLRFGLDREINTSKQEQYYPGTDRLLYEIRTTTPGAIVNGASIPAGYTAYVRTRRNEVNGEFETDNSALYIEDNWSVTDNLVLNAGLRLEAFDNKNSDGDSYIKMDNMLAPRFGFSWNPDGESKNKFFGNIGRYFLPVANVINIKQAGGFLDQRTFYLFNGFESFQYNGNSFQRPILGAQLGAVDNSQGDGTVGDLRSEVDANMDSVYQDELILGFQSQLNASWSWGVRGIYRKLNNAIDDMEITATSQCGADGYIGFVMANPGEVLSVYGDTDCDGEADGYIDIDTSKEGWALYNDDGDYIGQRGWVKPKRTYKALEFVIDRAWDNKWEFNAAYTLSYSEGNAEGPVNSDTDFADSGRTEAFDTPYVNLNADGPLPNDRRHQFKFLGSYALNNNWSLGASLAVASGRPISGFGVAAPGDDTAFYSFYTCVQNCTSDYAQSERVYELKKRGAFGRTPWITDMGASVSYEQDLGKGKLRAKLAVFNLLNSEHITQVDETREDDIGSLNGNFQNPTGWQSPRYGELTVSLDF